MIAAWALWMITDPAAGVGSINDDILGYFKLIGILALVLILAVFGTRVWLPKVLKSTRLAGSGPIQVAASHALEPRKNLYIVKTGADYCLLATSEAGVHWLTALDSDRIEPFLHMDERPPGSEPEFARLLKAFRRPKGGQS